MALSGLLGLAVFVPDGPTIQELDYYLVSPLLELRSSPLLGLGVLLSELGWFYF